MQNADRAAASAAKTDKTGPRLEVQFNSYKGELHAPFRSLPDMLKRSLLLD